MAFTATIAAIRVENDQAIIDVTFADSASGFTAKKQFLANLGDGSTTRATVAAQIAQAGQQLKANVAENAALQAQVGHVFTI